MWRVERAATPSLDDWKMYRVMNNRRVCARVCSNNAQLPIKVCTQMAFGCPVDIHWGSAL